MDNPKIGSQPGLEAKLHVDSESEPELEASFKLRHDTDT